VRARASVLPLCLAILASCRAESPESAGTLSLADLAEDSRVARIALGDETRKSLLTPFGAPLTLSIVLPSKPRLRSAIAIQAADGASSEVDFSVEVEDGGVVSKVFRERLLAAHGASWRERDIDLGAWAGKEVRLTFRADPPDRLTRRPARLAEVKERVVPLWGTPTVASGAAPREGRSIVLISLDCVRADHTSVYGYPRETTPRLARFAEDGVVFEQAMTTAPSTLPAHMSMFSGLTPRLARASNRARPEIDVLPGIRRSGIRDARGRLRSLRRAGFDRFGTTRCSVLERRDRRRGIEKLSLGRLRLLSLPPRLRPALAL
jgi:hypothetical protein